MRRAIADALLADDAVKAIVGERVYLGRGPYGGISRAETPEAFHPDSGELLPSMVVVRGARTAEAQAPTGPDGGRPAQQFVEVWCYATSGYEAVYAMTRAARDTLDRRIGLRPVEETGIHWLETRWVSDEREGLDGQLDPPVPFSAATFAAHIREIKESP